MENKSEIYGVFSTGGFMAERMDWPYKAAEARDQAAERMHETIQIIRPLMNGDRDGRIVLAILKLTEGLRYLESFGARTRPE